MTEQGISKMFYDCLLIQNFDKKMTNKILIIISNLVTLNENIEFFISLGILPVLIKLLNENVNTNGELPIEIMHNVFFILSNMAAGEQSHVKALTNSGILRHVLHTLKFHDTKKDMRDEALRLFKNLFENQATDQETYLELMKIKVLKLAIDCLKNTGDIDSIINSLKLIEYYLNTYMSLFQDIATLNMEFLSYFGQYNFNSLMYSNNEEIAKLATSINNFFESANTDPDAIVIDED